MERNRTMLADGIILIACVWLYVSPWVLKYGGNAGWNSTICAIVIAVLALARIFGTDRIPLAEQADWVSAVIGLWLILAPWVINSYEDTADKWSTVAMGAVIAIIATASEWLSAGEREHRPAV